MSRTTGLACAVTSGLLYAAAFPPADLGWVAFTALVPLLLVALDPATRGGRSFLLGWLAGTIACALLVTTSIVEAASRYFHLPLGTAWLAGSIAPQLYGAPYFGLFAFLASMIGRRNEGRPVWVALAVAAAWVACDFARSRLGDGCPWVLLAHSQHAHPLLLQVADVGGAAAVSFVVALVNAALAIGIRSLRAGETDGRRALVRLTVLLLLVLGTAVLYGRSRLAMWTAARGGDELRVAVVQGNVPDAWRYSLRDQPQALRTMQDLTATVRDVALDLVVWPENAVSVTPGGIAFGIAETARTLPAGAALLVGAPRVVQTEPGRASIYNSAFLIAGDGRVTPAYDKRSLTPWAEGAPWPLASIPGVWPRAPGAYSPGGLSPLPEVRGHRFGVAICSEAIDAELIADQVRRGASFLVDIANDGWFGDRPAVAQHANAALLRAVENRRWMVRATATGISTIVAPSGTVSASIATGNAGVIVASITPLAVTTPYTRLGDTIAWLCVIAAAVGALKAKGRP